MSKSTQIPVTDIILNEDNPRQMSEDKFPRLIESLLVFPKMLKTRPMVLDENGVVLGGNMRTRALLWIKDATLQQLKERLEAQSKYKNMTEYEQKQLIEFWQSWQARPKVYVTYAEGYTEEEKREFVIKDNTSFGDWDWNELANNWEPMELEEWGLDCWQPDKVAEGGDNDGSTGSSSEAGKHGSLSDKFIAPPFTILDTRQGYWRQRKAMWRERIADFGESREGTLADGETNCMATINNGVSLLDPVMAEIVCRWFGIEGGTAFDCFAGDTVFGYVAATLGMSFTGIELREEQATLNNERVEGMCARYICDDGQNVGKHIAAGSQDLLFSCPPYYDLEVYSDKPNDASNQPTYEAFLDILENAFANAIDCLKQNRFAVIVVGDIRDKEGYYYDFVGDIKRMFKAHGMPLYNECIIVEPIGTLPQRVQRYMRNRKVGKCHQNVLVFYKGDIKAIPTTYNEITYASEDLAAFGMDNNDTAE
ncbi:site-specific DNA-methyltransferase [Muribaculum intestinale]|uniref:site-specific DNA-methyltransferase n=1 Tax=Muribaculum intestinale TaxID=1796646 RepID=UPI00242B3FC3|nr:site-specific DNA-methyltransferase [Muribaculum intestinale]